MKSRKQDKVAINSLIDAQILIMMEELKKLNPKDSEYDRIVNNVRQLNELKEDSNTLNINTLVNVGGSLLVCVLALGFEKFGNGIFPWKISSFMPKK